MKERMMYRVFFCCFYRLVCCLVPLSGILLLQAAASASWIDSPIWINELHYDNDGADENEFVEVVAPTSLGDPANVSLTLYNGNSGSSYGGPTALSDFTRGTTSGDFTFYSWDVSLQNGAPDGLALADGDQVLQFLSYEGSFTATDGVADGVASTDIGVFEANDTPLNSSLQLAGSGNSFLDFSWQPAAANTLGGLNHDQSLSAVPEPGSLALWAVAAGLPLLAWNRRKWLHSKRNAA